MPVAVITVDFVNPPKPGKKKGSVKTKELGYVNVWPDKLPMFFKGQRCTIEFTESPSMNGGASFKDFVRMADEAPAGRSAPTSYNPPPQQTQRPQPPQAYPGQQRQAPPRPAPQPTYTPPIDNTSLNIFVTGIVGRAMGSGHFQPEDVMQLTENAVAAFMAHLNGGPKPQPAQHIASPQLADPPFFDDPLPHPDHYGAQPQDDDRIPY